MIEKRQNILVVAVIMGVLIILPFFVAEYWIRIFTGVFMYASLAQATNILMGFSGLVPFGNVVFFWYGSLSYRNFNAELGFSIFCWPYIWGCGLFYICHSRRFSYPETERALFCHRYHGNQ